jgi:hypothetical protein
MINEPLLDQYEPALSRWYLFLKHFCCHFINAVFSVYEHSNQKLSGIFRCLNGQVPEKTQTCESKSN